MSSAKQLDAVDFEIEREGGDFADAWSHQQMLNVGVGHQMRMEGFFELGDLIAEQKNLIDQTLEMKPILARQGQGLKLCIGCTGVQVILIEGEVEFFEEPVDAIDATDSFVH